MLRYGRGLLAVCLCFGLVVACGKEIVPEDPTEEKTEEKVDIPCLAGPSVKVERASCIVTEISWEAVAGAAGYEYVLDPKSAVGEDWEPSSEDITTATTELGVEFSGLEKDSSHTFAIRACSGDKEVNLDSPWVAVGFTAVDDYVMSLRIESVTPLADRITVSACVDQYETYVAGVLPKAAYLTESGEVDEEAIVAKINDGFAPEAVLHESMAAEFKAYYGTTYICYVYGVDADGVATSGLQYVEAKTSYFESGIKDAPAFYAVLDGGAWAEVTEIDDDSLECDCYWTYSNGGCVYIRLGNYSFKTYAEVKYALFEYDEFVSTYGATASSAAEMLKGYFGENGYSADLSRLNSSGVASLNLATEDGGKYVAAMYARDVDGCEIIFVKAVQAISSVAEWVHCVGVSESAKSGAYTVTCDLPVKSGKGAAFTLSTSNYRPEQIAGYMTSRGAALSNDRIKGLNDGTGYTASYNSLTSGYEYIYIVCLENLAGDLAYGCTVTAVQ